MPFDLDICRCKCRITRFQYSFISPKKNLHLLFFCCTLLQQCEGVVFESLLETLFFSSSKKNSFYISDKLLHRKRHFFDAKSNEIEILRRPRNNNGRKFISTLSHIWSTLSAENFLFESRLKIFSYTQTIFKIL